MDEEESAVSLLSDSNSESFDINAVITNNLPMIMRRRTKNSEKSLQELATILARIESCLLSQKVEFQGGTWSALKKFLVDLLKGGIKDDGTALISTLKILQLYVSSATMSIAREVREEAFEDVLETVKDLLDNETVKMMDENANSTILSTLFPIISTIYPVLFTNRLLSDPLTTLSSPIEVFTRKLIKLFVSSFSTTVNATEKKDILFKLQGMRLMQVVILMKSQRISDEEDEEESLGISSDKLAMKDKTSTATATVIVAIREEGQILFNSYLKLYQKLSSSTLTGWLNLLHPIIKTRPAFYPSLIPTLLSISEGNFSENVTSLIQKRNVLHTLKAELSTLMSVPRAEKFYSLILESLDKCALIASSTKSNAKKSSAMAVVEGENINIVDEEEEEKELIASLGGIQDGISLRPSGAFADNSNMKESADNISMSASSSSSSSSSVSSYCPLASDSLIRELIKVPPPLICEMVIRMLGSWTIEQIKPVCFNRWPRRVQEEPQQPQLSQSIQSTMAAPTTTSSFTLEPEPSTETTPGEIIHLGMARILQSINDLAEYHQSSRRDDLISDLNDNEIITTLETTAANKTKGTCGMFVPLVPLCRLIALVAAHVGNVKSDILIDPEQRRKRLDRQLDPRYQKPDVTATATATAKTSVKKDIFGSDSDEEESKSDDEDEYQKSVNQIVLGWINENLPNRFDFVWYWLEAVWVKEGKGGGIVGDDETNTNATSEYTKLFDDIVGLVGEYFISDEEDAEGESKKLVPVDVLERVLSVFLKVPKINATLIRNLLYPLIEEERYRSVALNALVKLIIQRPGLRAMLADFVMTLAESEDTALRRDTINLLLVRGGLYPGLRSLSSQLEAYSLDLMDELTKESTAIEKEREIMFEDQQQQQQDTEMEIDGVLERETKKLKVTPSTTSSSRDNILLTEAQDTEEAEVEDEEEDDFDANTELFLGLLKKNPKKLLPPLLVRFPRFSPKLQAFLLEKSLVPVVQVWELRELRGLLEIIKIDPKFDESGCTGELVNKLIRGVLQLLSQQIERRTEADFVDFYDEFAEFVQGKVISGIWDGRLVQPLLPWILRDRSDLPDFFSIYLPKLIAIGSKSFVEAIPTICSAASGQLITPTQLFVQLHMIQVGSGQLKNLIEVIQAIYAQVAQTNTNKNTNYLFNSTVISVGLGQLVELSTLPPLLGRSLLQSIPLLQSNGPLNGQLILSLLSRLISRKIWENGRLWEGWIRCCRALLPNSLSVILQLPAGQVQKLLQEGGADFKAPLKEYLYNQPPSVRNRYTSILATLEK